MSKYPKAWLVLAVIAWTGWGCGGNASQQQSVSMNLPPQPNRHVGFAAWPCPLAEPVSFVLSTIVLNDPTYARATAMHEADHEKYMKEKARTCVQWELVSRDPRVRVDMEARAFCVMAREMTKSGRFPSLDDAMTRYSLALMEYEVTQKAGYGLGDVHTLIKGHCDSG